MYRVLHFLAFSACFVITGLGYMVGLWYTVGALGLFGDSGGTRIFYAFVCVALLLLSEGMKRLTYRLNRRPAPRQR